MFQRIIDGISASTGTTVRLTSLAAGAAFALFITTCFLCAAAFISVLEKYGPVQACLTGAGIFFLLTLAAAEAIGATSGRCGHALASLPSAPRRRPRACSPIPC